ncbi:MAG: DUF2163 domain-containing protein [Hyphomonadaceae bacterium]
MRQISEAFAARLAADKTTLCACWRFTRRDGEVFGATDHDADLSLDGVTYSLAAGLGNVSFESGAGLAPGRATAEGALSLDFMRVDELDTGLWDGARVDVWRVDWRASEYRAMIWSGVLSEVGRTGDAFSAELVSLKAGLECRIGRVYSRRCDADVGDARCGVDLASESFSVSGVVGTIPSGLTFTTDALEGFASGWFTGGRLAWTSGVNAGLVQRIARHTGNQIEVAGPAKGVIAAGDAFSATAGCDKAFETCRAKFINGARFRGFPHMPGPEAVLAGPAASDANDGGRR